MQSTMLSSSQFQQYQNELISAKNSVSSGNIPRSRVCARRAAGILVKAWMVQHDQEIISNSSYDVLNSALSLKTLSAETKEIIEHFVLRVDDQYQFPAEIDLLSDLNRLQVLLAIEHGEE